MEILKYINVLQISSITSYLKYKNFRYIYKKQKKFLFWKQKEGYYRLDIYSDDKYIKIEEIEKFNNLYVENRNVYYKPYILIKMNNGDEHKKYFDTKEELYYFMECEELKNITWIK